MYRYVLEKSLPPGGRTCADVVEVVPKKIKNFIEQGRTRLRNGHWSIAREGEKYHFSAAGEGGGCITFGPLYIVRYKYTAVF
jgi:hypothetical protein